MIKIHELTVLLVLPDVRVEYHTDTDCYVVRLNECAIAADRDALTAVGQAWDIIQAHRAVAGLPPLTGLQQRLQQWRREIEARVRTP